jgi:hypothetical protein
VITAQVLGALLAMAVVGPPAPAAPHTQRIFVGWDATTKSCVPEVNGVATGDILTKEGREALVAAVPDKGGNVQLVGKAGARNLPYGCAIAISDALRHGGFYGKLGFNTEPTAAPTR